MYISGEQANKKSVGTMHIQEYEITPQFSGAVIDIDGTHGRVKCMAEDLIYFVAQGSGVFFVSDKKYDVKKDDVVFIPKKTIYNFSGKMKLFLVCSPEFKQEDYQYID